MDQEHPTDRPLSATGDTLPEIPLITLATPHHIHVNEMNEENSAEDERHIDAAWNTLDDSQLVGNVASGCLI